MRKPRMVGRGASSNVVAKDSLSPKSTNRELQCKLHRLRAVRVALAVVGLVSAAVAQTKQEVDLIVSGGIVVTMDGGRRILHGGSVAVKGDAIVAVGPEADVEGRYQGGQTIDARGKLVLP